MLIAFLFTLCYNKFTNKIRGVITIYSKIKSFLSNDRHYRNLHIATVIAFAFLIVEKLISSVTFADNSGEIYFNFALRIADIVYLGIYIAVTLLLLVKAKYKYVLIPDSVLFAMKLYMLLASAATLISYERINLLSELNLIEQMTEGFAFALFLTVFFCGKLSHSKKAKRLCPVICLAVLTFCFPATVVFEAVKVFIEENVYHMSLRMEILYFIKGVANEMFLDLPYALLVLLTFFEPEPTAEV